jgi:hypothetical protein
MSAILSSLSELVKYIADLFRLSTVFPAFIFVLLNQIFVVPYFKNLPLFSGLASLELKDQALIGAALAILGRIVGWANFSSAGSTDVWKCSKSRRTS